MDYDSGIERRSRLRSLFKTEFSSLYAELYEISFFDFISDVPKKPKENEEFEFTADGKLIISEDGKKGKGSASGGRDEDKDDEDEEDTFFQTPKPSAPGTGTRKRKHGGGAASVASSKRSLKSNQSFKSSQSLSSKKSRKGGEVKGTRPHLQAKRRKVKNSNSSVKSGRSDSTRGRKNKKENFNYKK